MNPSIPASGSANTNLIVPKPPQPMYPDVPWWSVLVTAIVFLITGVVAGVYFKAIPTTGIAGRISIGSLATDTISYIPHILLLFGVLADMFTLQGVWSIPSLVGLLSIFMNYVFEYFWKGLDELVRTGKAVATKASTPTTVATGTQTAGALFEGYTGCTVQGLEAWNSPYAPQTLVVTATVFSYYCYDLVRNRGWVNSIGAVMSFITLFLAEVAIIDMNTGSAGCVVDGRPMSTWGQGIRSLFEGLLFGGVSYAIVQTYAPARLPSSTISPFPARSSGDLSPGPDGRMYDKDGYPYVTLPNGMAVPDLSDKSSRAAFGGVAAKATGTTTNLASGCPGEKATCAKTI